MKSSRSAAGPGVRTVIRFEEGIPGFEDVKEYVLLREDEDNVVWSLEAADTGFPSLVVLDPFSIFGDYRPALSRAQLEYFGKEDPGELCYLVIAVIRPDSSACVANLKAPLIISAQSKKGRQVILEDSDYPIRYKLFGNSQ